MDIVLVVLGLCIWAIKSNIFKQELDDSNYLKFTVFYFFIDGLILTIFGLMVSKGNCINLIYKPYFYVLLIVESLLGLGVGILFNRSNATFTIALISLANVVASLFYSDKHGLLIIGMAIISIVSLYFYFRETGNTLNFNDCILSFLLVLIPTFIEVILMPVATHDFGNASIVYGTTLLIPFSIFMIKAGIKLDYKVKNTVIAAIMSALGYILIFYGLSVTSNVGLLLFILSLEAVLTEVSGYISKKDRLNLGKKSPLQISSIIVFSLSTAILAIVIAR